MAQLDLKISGDIHTDSHTLEKFSKDASSYKIKPKYVISPKTEDDILKTLEFANTEQLGVTCRAGGSGLSGAGIGPGIILDFKTHLDEVISLGEEMVVQPGTILDEFLKPMSALNLMLPSIPSSSAWCALGGNIGTRSTGPRTARYGTIDAFITSLKFITAKGEVVDTQKPLPSYLEEGLQNIKDRFQKDKKSQSVVAKRPYIGGGYNLLALTQYSNPRDMATHLLVGSVGTLAVVTEIRLKLIENRPSRGTCVAHFRDFDELVDAVAQSKALDPASLEFVDSFCSQLTKGKILSADHPSLVGTLIAEFDESDDQAKAGKNIFNRYDITKLWEIQAGSPEERSLWEDRRQILPSLWRFAKKRRWILPSIIDDIAFHLEDFRSVYQGLHDVMKSLGHKMALFGHIGFGSLHARPFFEPRRENLIAQITEVSQKTFNLLRNHNATLVGEHNAGRSRSVYLEEELGPAFDYMRQVKNLFDPQDLLNPGTVFDTEPITTHMDLSA